MFPHEEPVDPPLVGMDPDGVEDVVRRFKRQQRRGKFPGGQLSVRRHGRLIINEAVGNARGHGGADGQSEPLAATTKTLFPCFSAGKAVLAIAIALLEQRGLLNVRDPIVTHFPEFAAASDKEKREITILDVLTHRGGILMREFCSRLDEWPDWDKVRSAMINARPTHRRGTLAYHPLEYGWLLAEVAQRVTGEFFPTWLEREIARPCGLPRLRFGCEPEQVDQVAHPYWLGAPDGLIAGLQAARMFEDVATDPALATAFIPGAGLMTDAGTLAGFYAMLVNGGITQSGDRLLGLDVVRKYTTRHVMGWDRTNSAPIALGRGFFLGTLGPSLYGWWKTESAFGHAGAFCTLGFADHKTGLSVGIVTNGNRNPADLVMRMAPLGHALRAACK
ncbi:MAG: beta-lactamase family protein [Deltaproteobacteria bacterium]|nr:beta-lactamase family protein [Deltaproteobacteria bacterium]